MNLKALLCCGRRETKIAAARATLARARVLGALLLGGWGLAYAQVQTNWAVSATASSEYAPTAWSAAQATGAPDVVGCGDSPFAWSPRFGGLPEWLQVSFGSPRQAVGLHVHETLGGGFISRVDLIDADGSANTVWNRGGAIHDTTPCGDWFVLSFPPTSYQVVQARIYTDASDYIEIDAVGLLAAPMAGVPTIAAQPQNQAVLEGSSASFSVAASATPSPAYYWRCNGVLIPGATDPIYTAKDLVLADSGSQYSCLVSNIAGSVVSKPALLTVMPAGVDHFTWDTIASPQTANSPFQVRITARDAAGEVVTNFSAGVTLTGTSTQGSLLFSAGFDAADLTGWTDEGGGYDFQVSGRTLASGDRSLSLVGGDLRVCDGLAHAFANLKPDRVNFCLRASSDSAMGGYFVLGQSKYRTNSLAYFYLLFDGTMGLTSPDGTVWAASAAYEPNRWYRLSLALDWPSHTVAFYVDGLLIASGIPFCNPALSGVAALNLYNLELTQVWYDQIEFWQGGATAPALISPTAAAGFVDGVWTGQITIPQAATNLVLHTDDGSGHSGSSGPFQVLASAAAPVFLSPRQGDHGEFLFTLAGTTGATYQVEVSGDLRNWAVLRTVTMTNNTAVCIDASSFAARFYRARLLQ